MHNFPDRLSGSKRRSEVAPCHSFRKPLEDDMAKAAADHERCIRLRAERMWREAGSPKGREADYLEGARELQAFVDHPGAALLPNPMVAHPHPGGSEEPVEEAELL